MCQSCCYIIAYSMKYDEIEEKLRISPSFKLLRSRHAALMISFFNEHFKEANEIAQPYDYLVRELAAILDQTSFDDDDYPANQNLDQISKSKRLIEKWTEENWLRNYIDESNKKVYNVLTKHTEKVFQIIEMLKDREFVGTESKFKDIFFKLEDVVRNAQVDPAVRIAELEKQKEQIDQEIQKIKAEGQVSSYEDYQIKSRMDEVYRLTNELVGDFKEVEDNFKDITKGLYEKQALQTFTKGDLLGYAFDSVDKLKESDQGKSFYSFWQFLMNESEQYNLRMLIQRSIDALQDRGLDTNTKYLRKIKTLLHGAGLKVLESNDQLGEKLSRVIAEKNSGENKKSRETIQQIRLMALQLSEQELPGDCGISLELETQIHLPIERKLCEVQTANEYAIQPKRAAQTTDLKALGRLFNPNLIDKKRLNNQIHTLLTAREEISLREVIEHYPLEKGLSELVAYITLSNQWKKVEVNEAVTEAILFDGENQKYLETPQIVYKK